jgi:UDP-N-acetylglucosamine 2-epimerase
VILFHPDTLNAQDNRIWTQAIFDLIESRRDFNWFWFWPNPDHGSDEISKMIRTRRESGQLKSVRFVINTLPKWFIEIAVKAELIIGNSSFGIRESSFIPKNTLNLGSRQDKRQRADNVKDVKQPSELIQSFNSLTQINKPIARSLVYGQGNSGQLAAEAIIDWMPKLKIEKRHA